ncbi:hypothetical protein J2129_000285 [Methanofollis sp. W23]|nr:hypothetical protein [Methanofollis sp. W23]
MRQGRHDGRLRRECCCLRSIVRRGNGGCTPRHREEPERCTMKMILTIIFPGFYENLNQPDLVGDDMQIDERDAFRMLAFCLPPPFAIAMIGCATLIVEFFLSSRAGGCPPSPGPPTVRRGGGGRRVVVPRGVLRERRSTDPHTPETHDLVHHVCVNQGFMPDSTEPVRESFRGLLFRNFCGLVPFPERVLETLDYRQTLEFVRTMPLTCAHHVWGKDGLSLAYRLRWRGAVPSMRVDTR